MRPARRQTNEFRPTPVNGLGLAGFITSLVGLILTCGLLCPIGLLMSVPALFKAPRGFALAGTILGGIGTAFWIAVGGLMIAGYDEAHEGYRESPLAEHVAEELVDDAAELIRRREVTANRLLSFDEVRRIMAEEELEDPWGRTLEVRATEDGLREVLSTGLDGAFGGGDDIVRRVPLPRSR